MLYILSKTNLNTKDVVKLENYAIEENISLNGKSTFTLPRMPIAVKDDLVKYGDFIGVINNIESSKDSKKYKLSVLDIHSLFDRNLVLTNEELISSTGIEDFIAQIIHDRFTDSSDTLMNVDYLNVIVISHTPLNIEVKTADGLINLRTFLALTKQTYDIDLYFSISASQLNIIISKNTDSTKEIDLTQSPIIEYQSVFSIDVITKVTVYSKESLSETDYFLLNDGTISTNMSDSNRLIGKSVAVVVTTNAEIEQKAIDTFVTNSYSHNVSFSLTSDNRLYSKVEFSINRPLRVKTLENGVFLTFISKIKTSMKSKIIQVECGNAKTSLTDILKGAL